MTPITTLRRTRPSLGVFILGLLLAVSLTAQGRPQTVLTWVESISGTGETNLRWPVAVATADDGELAVVDAAKQRVVIFRDGGASVGWEIVGQVELPAAAFDMAACGDRYLVSLRQKGGLVAIHRENHVLEKLSLPPGVVAGAMDCTDKDGVLIHDLESGRILTWLRGEAIENQIRVEGHVTALAVGTGATFFVTIPDAAEVRRYGMSDEILAVIPIPPTGGAPAWPEGLVLETNGEIIVADRHAGRLLVLEATGRVSGFGSRKGFEPGLLRSPADLARFPDGRIAVADLGNGRVQIFQWVEP